MSAKCRACAAPITWARTPAGKLMPLDPEPASNGSWIYADGAARPAHDDDEGPRYCVHWATCTDPNSFRRKAP